MSDDALVVVLGGRVLGRVERGRGGRLRLVYDDEWRQWADAVPLSLCMPLAAAEHGHQPLDAFLWGLLPDNPLVLDAWARRFQVSPRNAFALLAQVGEDCAGAAQFVRPERLDAVLDDAAWEVAWLDETGVAERLRLLATDRSAWRSGRDTGQFSLAGSQPKTALLFQDGRWGVPAGRAPTTHILKPPIAELDGHVENEHLCLALARELGLPAARSDVRRFGDQTAIVVERFDRLPTTSGTPRKPKQAGATRSPPIRRVHQEDVCQALGLAPSAKYQNERGPSPADVAELLRTHSLHPVDDVQAFVDALAFNWLIGGTDAHAKNYALLHGGGGRVRLAPLYDLASALPHDDLDPQRITLAMKIGGHYRIRDVTGRDWERLARELRLAPDAVLDRVSGLGSRLPDAAVRVSDRARAQGLTHLIVDALVTRLVERAVEVQRVLAHP